MAPATRARSELPLFDVGAIVVGDGTGSEEPAPTGVAPIAGDGVLTSGLGVCITGCTPWFALTAGLWLHRGAAVGAADDAGARLAAAGGAGAGVAAAGDAGAGVAAAGDAGAVVAAAGGAGAGGAGAGV